MGRIPRSPFGCHKRAGHAGERRVPAAGPRHTGRILRSPFGVNGPGAQARDAFVRLDLGARGAFRGAPLASAGRARRGEARSRAWPLARGARSEEPLWRQQAGRAGERRVLGARGAFRGAPLAGINGPAAQVGGVLAAGPWLTGRIPRSPFGVNRPGAQARRAFLRLALGARGAFRGAPLASAGRARRREARSCGWPLAHGARSEEPLWRQQAGRAGERRILAAGARGAFRGAPLAPAGRVRRQDARSCGWPLAHGARSEEPLWHQRAGRAGETSGSKYNIHILALSLSLPLPITTKNKTKQNKTKQNNIYIYRGLCQIGLF